MAGILTCIVAILGVAAVSGIRGRVAGVALSTICAAIIAFFIMPPVFSIRVMRAFDVMVLAGYGLTSLFIAVLFGSRQHFETAVPADFTGYHSSNQAIAAAREAHELIKIIVAPDGLRRPPRILHPHAQSESVIGEVMKIAFEQMQTVHRVSLFAGSRPSLELYWLALQHQPDPTLPYNLTIGLNDDARSPIIQAGWPTRYRVTWFDNGVERVYQITIRIAKV